MASCSSKTSPDSESSEIEQETITEDTSSTVEETNPNSTVEETTPNEVEPVFGADGVYNPPFETSFEINERDQYGQDTKQTIILQLLANGRVKGSYSTKKYLFNSNDEKYDWRDVKDMCGELRGKWSSYSRRLGNGYQNIYEIDINGTEYSYFMPDDAEYIWGGQNGYYNCENYNTEKGWKVMEIKPIS